MLLLSCLQLRERFLPVKSLIFTPQDRLLARLVSANTTCVSLRNLERKKTVYETKYSTLLLAHGPLNCCKSTDNRSSCRCVCRAELNSVRVVVGWKFLEVGSCSWKKFVQKKILLLYTRRAVTHRDVCTLAEAALKTAQKEERERRQTETYRHTDNDERETERKNNFNFFF